MVKKREEKYLDKITVALKEGNIKRDFAFAEDKYLPPPEKVREIFEKEFNVASDRTFRIILVEDFKDYIVFLQIPNGKSKYDFNVWYAKYKKNELEEISIPTHDYLGNWYRELKEKSEIIEEYLINAILRSIRDREPVLEVVNKFFRSLKDPLKIEIRKFLCTLKWIALQEDINYPPPKYMGSKYTLAVYALLEAGFELKDLRRIIRFR